MRQHFFILSTLIALLSCTDDKQSTQQEVPKALEEQKNSYGIASKRGYDDMVESIYSELVDQTPELKKLEEDIEAVNNSKSDSLEAFQKFDSKNDRFYSSAQTHAGQIKDSLLQNRMKKMIASDLSNYHSLVSPHNNLLESIESREATLYDLHLALKITRTLPVINRYQKNNFPATQSLEGFSRKLAETAKEAETLLNK